MKKQFSNSSVFLRVLLLSAILSVICLAQQLAGLSLKLPPEITQTQASTSLDAATRQAVLEDIMKNVKENYLSLEVAEKMNQDLQARIARKEYDQITNPKEFADLLTQQLRAICHDKHVSLRVASSQAPSDPFPAEQTRQKNYGFPKAEVLEGNIGYLKINEFPPQEAAGKKLTAAMSFLADTDALIVDVREHRGGTSQMVALLVSYLVPDKIKLSTVTFPRRGMSNELWTLEKVEGPRYLNKPVYLLTSSRTGSAGEAMSYDLQSLKRAMLIGEITAGAGNPVGFFPIKGNFVLGLGIAVVKNAITGANWEAIGVKPDIEISATEALTKALELARKQVADTRQANQAAPTSAPKSQASGSSSSSLPDTPAGHALKNFVAALNSGEIEKMRKFHQDSGGDVNNADVDLSLYKQSGGWVLHSVTKSSDYEIGVLVQTKKDSTWFSFVIQVGKDNPYPILNIQKQPASAPANPAPLIKL